MIANKTINLLESFISGRVDISKFTRQINDRLFELRQKPAMTQEKKLLSKIQLYLHEADEGIREVFEVYMVSQSVLDLARPLTEVIEGEVDTVFSFPVKAGNVLMGSDSRSGDFTHDKVSVA